MEANLYSGVFDGGSRSNSGSSIAVIDIDRQDGQISYGQLQGFVDAASGTTNIEADEKVALIMPNSLELIVGLFTVWAQGAAAAPFNPSFTSSEFKVCYSDTPWDT